MYIPFSRWSCSCPSVRGRCALLLIAVLVTLVPGSVLALQDAPAPPAPDTLIFTNGDQLTGKLVRATGGTVTFHSDMAGDLDIPVAKIKELRSSGSFAILKKDQNVVGALVRPSSVHIEDGKLISTSGLQPVDTIPVADLGFIIDEPTFRRETNPHPSFLYGWNGSIAAGATLVRSTQRDTTLTTAINLVRTIPTVTFLPPRNRTTVDVAETYGTSHSPGAIPQTNPLTPDSNVKSSIFHADAEQDEYLSKRLYYFGGVAFDHNYSQGLDLQQIYGGGIGFTVFSTPRSELDLKADIHYERQTFFISSNNTELVGSIFAEDYRRNLPGKIVFTEFGNYIPSWNDPSAYSANITGALALPLFKRFAASVSATDNYLNNPSLGYRKNSFLFVTGVAYSLK